MEKMTAVVPPKEIYGTAIEKIELPVFVIYNKIIGMDMSHIS